MSTRNSRAGDVLNILGTTEITGGRILGRAKTPARSVGVERLREIGAALGWSDDETERAIQAGISDGTWIGDR